MIGLTAKQQELLSFIEFYMAEAGISPSFDEMREAVGFKAKSGVFRLIEALEERGHVRRIRGRARALELCSASVDLSKVPADALLAELARRGAIGAA